MRITESGIWFWEVEPAAFVNQTRNCCATWYTGTLADTAVQRPLYVSHAPHILTYLVMWPTHGLHESCLFCIILNCIQSKADLTKLDLTKQANSDSPAGASTAQCFYELALTTQIGADFDLNKYFEKQIPLKKEKFRMCFVRTHVDYCATTEKKKES